MKALDVFSSKTLLAVLAACFVLSFKAGAAVIVEGVVSDADTGATLDGATVFVGISEGSGRTDASGRYAITLERPGSFDLKVFKSGYELLVIEDVVFTEGKTVERDLRLKTVGGLGPLTRTGDEELEAIPEGTGSVEGQVTDAVRGRPLVGVTVTLVSPEETIPEQTIATERGGRYRFSDLPTGYYTLRFTYPEHQPATLTDVAIRPDEVTTWDWGLTEVPSDLGGDVFIMDAFEVSAEVMTQKEFNFQVLRKDAISMVDLFSAEDFSRFAASDVAAAITRVVGVNVVEGQFAIIRGLEDRYSSTTYNGLTVPSPDPVRQSVQLDLFPSDIVDNLVVSKTFSGNLPSNSSGGSIDILSHDFPDAFEATLSVGTGINQNAADRFIETQGRTPLGLEVSSSDVWEGSIGLVVGHATKLFGRDLKLQALATWDRGFGSKTGFVESREPRASDFRRFPAPGVYRRSGDLALGELSLSAGRFDLIQSTQTEQVNAFLGSELKLDAAGSHTVKGSLFYTRKEENVAQLRENGIFPNWDYSQFADAQNDGREISADQSLTGTATLSAWMRGSIRNDPGDTLARGGIWYAPFESARSFLRERDLIIAQVNGRHFGFAWEGLELDWAVNWAETTQEEGAYGVNYFFEPDDLSGIPQAPLTAGELGPGRYLARNDLSLSENGVTETHVSGRIDALQTWDVNPDLLLKFETGLQYEKAEREADTTFLESPTKGGLGQVSLSVPKGVRGADFFAQLDSTDGQLSGQRQSVSDAEREIAAGYFSVLGTYDERFDLRIGARYERLQITSRNDPFTGELAFDGSPGIFPSKWLYLDRLDNPANGEGPIGSSPFNDELIGIELPLDPVTGLVDLKTREELESFLNQSIDEHHLLPHVEATWRVNENLTFRAAWSQSVARPSFREIGYYVSVSETSDDLIVGNPLLRLSDVESWDARVEYVWGAEGDLLAASVFSKTLSNPIESIVIRNPTNLEGAGSGQYRTFFNNPSDAELEGVEVEVRKSLGFLGDFGQYLSIGSNYTWIGAEVARTEAEKVRAGRFFGVAPGDTELFIGLSETRRLFGQPEWIFNADLSFDQPEWGTQVTLAYFAISSILDAAGSAATGNDGQVESLTLDRYVDQFEQVDLVIRQELGDFSLKFSIKNLTDSPRGIIYDPGQTREEIAERRLRSGRDYSVSLSYSF